MLAEPVTIILVGLGVVLVAALVIVWPRRGFGFVWTDAPGGALKYRVRRKSLLPRLLGSDGIALFGVVHFAKATTSGYLFAHELCHLLQARDEGGWHRFLWKYLTRPTFRATSEAGAYIFGITYADNHTLNTHRRWAGMILH